jgi:hypothetical protein
MSADKSGKAEEELTFVVTTNPYDKSSVANKRRVRSVAALKSWPERRKKTFDNNPDSTGARGGFVLDPPEPSTSRPTPAKRKRKISELPTTSAQVQWVPQEDDVEPLFEKCTRAFNDDCACIHCRSERSYLFRRPDATTFATRFGFEQYVPKRSLKRTADGQLKPRIPEGDLARITPPSSPSPSPLEMMPNEGRAEPFNCYPVPYRPWFDQILSHSMFNGDAFAGKWRGLTLLQC